MRIADEDLAGGSTSPSTIGSVLGQGRLLQALIAIFHHNGAIDFEPLLRTARLRYQAARLDGSPADIVDAHAEEVRLLEAGIAGRGFRVD